MDIVIFGGTFNPPTRAHEWMVLELGDEFDRVLVVPTAVTWHKKPISQDEVGFTFDERLELCEYAFKSDDPTLEVLDIERKYIGVEGHGFADTLQDIMDMYGHEHNYTVAMGGDSFEMLHLWKNHEFILAHANILVFDRPGYTSENEHIRAHVVHWTCPDEVSSTQARKLLHELCGDVSNIYTAGKCLEIIQRRDLDWDDDKFNGRSYDRQ